MSNVMIDRLRRGAGSGRLILAGSAVVAVVISLAAALLISHYGL